MRAWISYDGVTRVERYPFPRTAIREAVFNAIIHSDYSSGVPIQIRVYDKKLVIYNQARIPLLWVQEGALDKHGSKAINPLIARAFYRAGYVESWGRGIKRMADACREYGTAPQTYSFTDSEVVTVFESGGGDEPVALTERQVRILEKLRECPKATRADLAGYLNVSLVTIKRDLAGLTESGCIIRRGSDKNGEWFVNVGRCDAGE